MCVGVFVFVCVCMCICIQITIIYLQQSEPFKYYSHVYWREFWAQVFFNHNHDEVLKNNFKNNEGRG